MSILGDFLKFMRLREGLTQKSVAEHLGILPHNYTPYETGKKLPDDVVLRKLALIYSVTSEELIKYKEASAIARKYQPEAIKIAAYFQEALSEVTVEEAEKALWTKYGPGFLARIEEPRSNPPDEESKGSEL